MRLLISLLALLTAATAHAEWTADVYAGGAHTPRSNMTLLVNTAFSGQADHEFHNVRWENSLELGARASWWLPSAPWYGVGVEFFHFDADIPSQTVDTTIRGTTAPATLGEIDVSVMTLAFDLVRLRYRGALQPYFNAGPALFRVKVTNKGNSELTNKPATDTAWGYLLGAGVAWPFAKNAALFSEFRYSHVKAEPVLESTLSPASIPLRFDLNTQHLIVGLNYAF